MGNVLVSLDEEHEQLLRGLVREKGNKKGDIRAVVQFGLDKIKEELPRNSAKENLIKQMEKGYKFHYTGYKKRSELYD